MESFWRNLKNELTSLPLRDPSRGWGLHSWVHRDLLKPPKTPFASRLYCAGCVRAKFRHPEGCRLRCECPLLTGHLTWPEERMLLSAIFTLIDQEAVKGNRFKTISSPKGMTPFICYRGRYLPNWKSQYFCGLLEITPNKMINSQLLIQGALKKPSATFLEDNVAWEKYIVSLVSKSELWYKRS